jgi:hypothetical protein
MCRTWLKYALPTLADVPRAEGSFDLQFDQVDVPLNRPEMANVKGAIVLHNGTLGAGPLTDVVLRISDALSALGDRRLHLSERAGGTWVEIPAQVVAFEMKDGRVVHRELQLKVRDLTIYSRGSVGVDQTYDLVLEVPIPEADNPNSRLASLAGRTYRFPLRGRFGEKVDVAAVLGDLARELARQSAGAAAESLLDEGLRRLFRDRQ